MSLKHVKTARPSLQFGQTFIDEAPIAEGITAIWLPGHTGYRINSGDRCLLIWGDTDHFPHVQSAYPSVSIVFDVDPVLAEETRKTILEQAVRENWSLQACIQA